MFLQEFSSVFFSMTTNFTNQYDAFCGWIIEEDIKAINKICPIKGVTSNA